MSLQLFLNLHNRCSRRFVKNHACIGLLVDE
jgi:hypothetical protein